ncbi:MAG: hypothetical protein ACYT04_52175 [Nostoc sp.]
MTRFIDHATADCLGMLTDYFCSVRSNVLLDYALATISRFPSNPTDYQDVGLGKASTQPTIFFATF